MYVRKEEPEGSDKIMTSVVVVGTNGVMKVKGRLQTSFQRMQKWLHVTKVVIMQVTRLWIDGKKFKLHLIPSGIFFPEKISVIGNGMVVNPKSLVKELSYLHEEGVTTDNLRISDRAHVILPYHIELDRCKKKLRATIRWYYN